MPKKRKTRKEKEKTVVRHAEQIAHIHIDTPTYSVAGLKTEKLDTPVKKPKDALITFEQKDAAYLKHDISAITAASGIILAFDLLLFVVLSTGVLKLNFLGY